MSPRPRLRRPSPFLRRLAAALALALCLRGPAIPLPRPARAYVTSGLPARTHQAFLRQLTADLCGAAPGTLTPQEVRTAPALIEAWAGAAGRRGRAPAREGALAVEGLLQRLVVERRAGNPAAVARTADYNAALRSWARSGEGGAAATRVEQILRSMQQRYSAGDADVQPNVESFQIAVDAWAAAGDTAGLGRATQILEWMAGLYLSGANIHAAPSAAGFRPVLRGWAESGQLEAPVTAENLLLWMQRLQREGGIAAAGPDTKCFNLLATTWLRSGDIAAERKIRQVFEYLDMCRRRGSADLKPDADTYGLAIAAIAPAIKSRQGGARRADRLLARMEAGCRAGNPALRPDTVAYNTVIDYWAKAQAHKGHYLKARAVLDRQTALHKEGVKKCRPDTVGYTAVVAAGASASGSRAERRRAYAVTRAAFEEACKKEHTRPNAVTYGLMFKAIGRLLPQGKEREQHARELFQRCVADGCLGEMAYKRVKAAASPALWHELTSGRSYKQVPPAWRARAGESVSPGKKLRQSRKATKKGELRP